MNDIILICYLFITVALYILASSAFIELVTNQLLLTTLFG